MKKLIKLFFVTAFLLSAEAAFAQNEESNKAQNIAESNSQDNSPEAEKINSKTGEVINDEQAVKEDKAAKQAEKEEEKELAKDATPEASEGNSTIKSLLNSNGEINIENYSIDKDLLKRVYEKYNFQPIFFTADGADRLNKAYELLDKAEENGLNSSEFNSELFKKRAAADTNTSKAKTDVLLTQKLVNFIQQVRYGKKLPKDIGFETYFRFIPKTLDVVSAFNQALTTNDTEAFVTSISPKHEEYQQLKEALKKVMAEEDDNFKYIDDNGVDIAPGATDYRIPTIRARLKSKRPLNPKEANNKNFYDSELVKDIKKFQSAVGSDNGGVIDKDTIKRLNIGKKEKISIVKMNMERWRWLPDVYSETGKYIIISLTEYKFRAYENNELVSEMLAVVGRAKRRTPIMNTLVLNMTFQPFWYVPRKYATELLVPQLQKNNRYLEKDGILVYRGTANGGQELVDPTNVDWSKVTDSNYNFSMRQNPGEKNVLGQVKFQLLNDKEIFMHGTSEPTVFSKDLRAISAGCIRVEYPPKVASYLIENNADRKYSEEELTKLYTAHQSGLPYEDRPKSIRIDLKNKIPMYVVYFTAYVENGELKLRDDLYNIDAQMAAAFNK